MPPDQPADPPAVPLRSLPIGLLSLLAVATVLYVVMLYDGATIRAGGGDAAMGEALGALFLIVGLWVVLAVMLIAAGVTGEMPRWAAGAAVILVPVSGVAAAVAVDMISRHMPGAIVVPILLPALIVFYAFWARMPELRTRMPAKGTSFAVWGVVLAISILTFIAAA